MVTVTAVYAGGVLRPDAPLDLPEGASVNVQIRGVSGNDPKDALMADEDALRAMYAEFGPEDRKLAQTGLAHYADTLRREENSA